MEHTFIVPIPKEYYPSIKLLPEQKQFEALVTYESDQNGLLPSTIKITLENEWLGALVNLKLLMLDVVHACSTHWQDTKR